MGDIPCCKKEHLNNLIIFLYVLQEAGEVTSKYAGNVLYIAFWGVI